MWFIYQFIGNDKEEKLFLFFLLPPLSNAVERPTDGPTEGLTNQPTRKKPGEEEKLFLFFPPRASVQRARLCDTFGRVQWAGALERPTDGPTEGFTNQPTRKKPGEEEKLFLFFPPRASVQRARLYDTFGRVRWAGALERPTDGPTEGRNDL